MQHLVLLLDLAFKQYGSFGSSKGLPPRVVGEPGSRNVRLWRKNLVTLW
jgi:hypothetical protein